jgi:hypothetical protein
MTSIQQGVCAAVSTYTGVKKQTVVDRVQEYFASEGADSPVMHIELPEVQFSLKIGQSQGTILLGKMLFFKSLEKTELFSETTNILRNESDAVAFYSKGALMVIRIAHKYSGIGGVFVKRSVDSTVGYIIEPIKHYLMDNHPITLIE